MATSNFAKELDTLIREGHAQRARRMFQEAYRRHEMPKEKAVEFARLARRLDLSEIGLRLLAPFIRTEGKKAAKPAEVIGYSLCLTKIGAPQEAWRLLMELTGKLPPEADFAKAAALIERWDYDGALPLLKKYVRAEGLVEYDRLVGNVNLAAVLVHERKFREADMLLHELFHFTAVRKLTLLRGNLYEIAAYHSIAHKKFAQATKLLEEAAAFLRETGSTDEFFIRKWTAILQVLRDRDKSALNDVRQESLRRGLWETSRDGDRFEAMALKDVVLGRHLYFGTPYPGFRERFVDDFEGSLDSETPYAWNPFDGGGEGAFLDLATGESKSGKVVLPPGRLEHRLLSTLATDFYRPFRIPMLFERMFPGEFYHPESSVTRVRQALKLLRKRLVENGLPLELELASSGYRLVAKDCVTLVVHATARGANKFDLFLARTQARWPLDRFGVQEASKLLNVSNRTVQRLLRWAHESGRLKRFGTGSKIQYQFSADVSTPPNV